MNTIPTSLVVRSSMQIAALLLSFSLGSWLNRPAMPGTVNGPVSRGNGSSCSAPASNASNPATASTAAVQHLAPTRPPPAAAPDGGRNARRAGLIGQMKELNQPQTIAALHRLDQQGDGPEQRLTRQLLVSRFAEIDPQTALTYVDTLSGDERSSQKINALGTWASKAPQEASAYFENNILTGGIASEDDAHAAAAIAGEWAQTHPAAAWNWVTSLPGDVRAEAVSRVALRLAETSSAAAMQAVSSLPHSDERAAVMQPLAARWAESSPAKTATWVQSLGSNTDEQASAAAGLVTSWMNGDAMAVSRWVSFLPAGKTRDSAINAMVGSQSLKNDPEAATLWAATVQDDTLRSELVARSLRRWQMHNPDAASRWAATASR